MDEESHHAHDPANEPTDQPQTHHCPHSSYSRCKHTHTRMMTMERKAEKMQYPNYRNQCMLRRIYLKVLSQKSLENAFYMCEHPKCL